VGNEDLEWGCRKNCRAWRSCKEDSVNHRKWRELINLNNSNIQDVNEWFFGTGSPGPSWIMGSFVVSWLHWHPHHAAVYCKNIVSVTQLSDLHFTRIVMVSLSLNSTGAVSSWQMSWGNRACRTCQTRMLHGR